MSAGRAQSPKVVAHPAFLRELRRILPRERYERVRALLDRGDATWDELRALLPDIEFVNVDEEQKR